MPRDHPLAASREPSLEEVAEHAIVTYVFGVTGRSRLDEAFHARGLKPRVVFTATDADPVKSSLTNMLSNGFLFIVLVVLISLNNSFYTRINQGLVADEFNQFSTLAAVMITLQLIVIGKEETVQKDSIRKRDRWITYLLSMFSLIFAAMQAVILKYYSTEG